MLCALQLFAVYAQDSAMRVLLLPRTRCRLGSVRWKSIACDGHGGQDGAILQIAESSAADHLNNAVRKLSCVNHAQAALRALRLGLIR